MGGACSPVCLVHRLSRGADGEQVGPAGPGVEIKRKRPPSGFPGPVSSAVRPDYVHVSGLPVNFPLMIQGSRMALCRISHTTQGLSVKGNHRAPCSDVTKNFKGTAAEQETKSEGVLLSRACDCADCGPVGASPGFVLPATQRTSSKSDRTRRERWPSHLNKRC